VTNNSNAMKYLNSCKQQQCYEIFSQVLKQMSQYHVMQYHQSSITSQSQLIFTLDHVISQRSEVIVNKSHTINSVQKHVVIIIIQLEKRRSSWLWVTWHCEYKQHSDYEWFRAEYTYQYDYSVSMKHDTRSKIQEAKYISYSDILLDSNLSKKILKLTSIDKANKSEQDLSKI